MDKDFNFMKSKTKITLALFGLIAIVLISSQSSEAALTSKQTIKTILLTFHDTAANWEGTLQGFALRLFWLLASIEFLWTSIKLVFKGWDLTEFLAELVSRILYIGFWLTFLLHSSEWATFIINSCRIAADKAAGSYLLTPSNILAVGVEIASKLFNQFNPLNPVDYIMTALCGLSILICFALMAANMIEALLESYIVISAGVLMTGFGGSSWTNDYAKKYLTYALSAGIRLFILQLLMGMGEKLIKLFSTQFDASRLEDAMVMVGVAVAMWIVTLNVPNKIQGLINGAVIGNGGIIAGAIAGAASIGAQAAMSAASGGSSGGASAANAAKTIQEELSQTPTENPRMIDPYLRANPDAKTDGGLGHRPGNNSYPSQSTSNTISPEKDD
jgi:type IV secretion system protein TrbL